MSYSKPFHRNYRPLIEGPNSGYSSWKYITDHEYSQNPTQYTRGFYMIQKDLQELFEYIEPSDTNLKAYSYRIHQLLVRTCIEIEANFKAILKENIYSKHENLTRTDYKIINQTHHLSDYSVKFPYWNGDKNKFVPFEGWGSSGNGKKHLLGVCGLKRLSKDYVNEYNISLPPLPEQKRIIKELDTLSEKVRQLQEIYTKQIANCDELKQSLLQKAFEGEL